MLVSIYQYLPSKRHPHSSLRLPNIYLTIMQVDFPAYVLQILKTSIREFLSGFVLSVLFHIMLCPFGFVLLQFKNTKLQVDFPA